MIQGTGSTVGKSFIVAGLGRILKNDGFKVAPYKSQNMSLNSAVSIEGTEISRAQAMQAQACGILPQAIHNPILLKPQSDQKAQLIVNGEIVGNYGAKEYHQMKLSLLDKCVQSLNELEKLVDYVIIEGAGSPAEINLMDEDIANMKIAHAADCPVVLVADIDKGGVFASIYGTYELLPQKDRNKIAGFIINKFRGDKKLLQSGIDFIEAKTGVPVIGVIPYINIELDPEDSHGVETFSSRSQSMTSHGINVAVIKLPRISNFTDFWSLQKESDVSLRYVQNPNELKNIDLIIIPGSKSVISDLGWLNETGLTKAINKSSAYVLGICGGFQMLGKTIKDENAVESNIKLTTGLNMLDVDTFFDLKKTTRQTKIKLKNILHFKDLDDIEIEGYEIHNGQSISNKANQATILETSEKVLGTYLHGLFDNDHFRRTFINIIRKDKGFKPIKTTYSFKEYKEQQYEKLADLLRKNLDMYKIYNLLNIAWYGSARTSKKDMRQVKQA